MIDFEKELEITTEVKEVIDFIKNSDRGII